MKENNQILISQCTTALSKEGNKAANKVFRLLAQKQFKGLVKTNTAGDMEDAIFELQTAQMQLLTTVIRLFDATHRPKNTSWLVQDVTKAAEKYMDCRVKYMIELFGEEKYNQLWGAQA